MKKFTNIFKLKKEQELLPNITVNNDGSCISAQPIKVEISNNNKNMPETDYNYVPKNLYNDVALDCEDINGAILTAPMGLGRAITGKIEGAIKPYFGRKISQLTAKGLGNGVVGGAVEGGLRGYKDGHPVKTAMKDASIGGILGALGGVTLGKIGQKIDGYKLKNYPSIDGLSSKGRKLFRKDSKQYYKDYIQDTSIQKNGKIEFTKSGQSENSRWNPKQGKNYPELKQDIKKAKQLPNRKNIDPNKVNTNYIGVFQGKNGQHLIDVDNKGRKRYYMTVDNGDTASLQPSATSTSGTDSIDIIVPHFIGKTIPNTNTNIDESFLIPQNRVFYNGELNPAKTTEDEYVDPLLEQYYSNDKKLPSEEELKQKVLSGELTYIPKYKLKNGKIISGYYKNLKQ